MALKEPVDEPPLYVKPEAYQSRKDAVCMKIRYRDLREGADDLTYRGVPVVLGSVRGSGTEGVVRDTWVGLRMSESKTTRPR